MKPLKCLIIDDEPKGREVLKSLIEEYCPEMAVAGMGESVPEAIKLIHKHEPDIVFLDIEMPNQNGFKLFEYFDEVEFEVVFTTAYDEYAIRAIKFSALDYLLKPINVQELQQAAARFRNRKELMMDKRQLTILNGGLNRNEIKQIALPSQDGYEILELEDIIRVSSEGSYTVFHLKDGQKVMISRNMGEYENLLGSSKFYRIHHSHMINLRYLRSYIRGRGGRVILSDGTELDVAARRKDGFLKEVGLE